VTTIFHEGCVLEIFISAVSVLFRASVHENQKPRWTRHFGHKSDSVRVKLTSVILFNSEAVPRKEMTTSLLVWSAATKPVTSVNSELEGVSPLVKFQLVGNDLLGELDFRSSVCCFYERTIVRSTSNL
jgi:hypothetical protein